MLRSASRGLAAVAAFLAASATIAAEGRRPIYTWPTTINTSGKYVVTRNINASGSGSVVINIQASDVDVDLNGFVLQTDGAPVISAVGVDNVTIRNGTLLRGTRGIEVRGTALAPRRKVQIEYVNTIGATTEGLFLQFVSDFAIRWNNVLNSGQEAIWIEGSGGTTPFHVQGTIEHNRVENCGGGIWVRYGSSVGVLNNRIESINHVASPAPPAEGGAIVFDYSDVCLISENTIEFVKGAVLPKDGNGIYIADARSCKVYNNLVRDVSDDGIDLAGMSDDNLVLNNVVSLAGNDGLRVEGSRNHVDRNVLNSNCQSGPGACWGLHFVLLAAFPGSDNTYGRNTARGNQGMAGACPSAPSPPASPPTADFCDEQPPLIIGNTSFLDNFMPNFF